MTDLLTRLESSEGSDHQLTIDICEALKLAPKEYFGSPVISYSWDSGVINTVKARHLDALRPPPILTSIDAALSLVERTLPGKEVEIVITPTGTKCTIFVEAAPGAWDGHKGRNKTPARAACAALLRALDQEPQT